MSLPPVGTVVLHYRRLEDSRRCLASLSKLDYPDHRLLVVDNASGDGSAEALAQEFPEVPQLRLPANLGYTGGNNRGMEVFLEEGVDYVQLLNSDVEVVEGDYLRRLVSALERRPSWGAAGPRVFFHGPDKVQMTWHAFPSLGRLVGGSLRPPPPAFPVEEAPGEEREVDAANGVCLLLRAAALREAGGFDEDLFMYGEEVELCYRLARLGWRTGHVPAPSVIHHPLDTRGGFTVPHNYIRANTVRMLRKHRGPAAAGVAALWLALTGTAKAAVGGGPGLGRYLAELWGALRGRPVRPQGGGPTPA